MAFKWYTMFDILIETSVSFEHLLWIWVWAKKDTQMRKNVSLWFYYQNFRKRDKMALQNSQSSNGCLKKKKRWKIQENKKKLKKKKNSKGALLKPTKPNKVKYTLIFSVPDTNFLFLNRVCIAQWGITTFQVQNSETIIQYCIQNLPIVIKKLKLKA